MHDEIGNIPKLGPNRYLTAGLCFVASELLASGSLDSGGSRAKDRMTIVIQQMDTRQFLAGYDEWVADPHEALSFNDTRQALHYCRRHELENVRLVIFFRDKKVSLLLYVPGSKTPAPAGALRTAS